MPSISANLPTARRSRAVLVAVPLTVTALLLAACSSSGGGGSSAPSSASSAAAAGGSAATGIRLTHGHLTDASGRTVYLWVADKGTRSTCAGSCAAVWPAVTASGTPSVGPGLTGRLLTKSHRADGSTQLDYAGHPLYYYQPDTTAGTAKGQGSDDFGAKWWELNAAGKAITSAATPSAGSSSSGGGYGY